MVSNQWTQLGISEESISILKANGIESPTEVQTEAIPALLEGKDISVRSQTGSGKTLAFLLPILEKINPASNDIQAVILSPTQELAMQIVRVAETYGLPRGIKIQQLIGGAAAKRQIEKLKQRPHIVIGTPGRMNELVKSKKLKLHAVKFLIIDEADQTFELGSPQDIEHLLFSMNKHRQTAFFSATYPEIMTRYEGRWMKNSDRIMISPEQRVSATIQHYYIVSDMRNKLDVARRLIRTLNVPSALLFVNDTTQISNWESKLKYEGFKVEALYGDADKQRRASTLSAFREGKIQLLLSTDVTARGIDIQQLPLVIQLEPAIDSDHYVHRAGRTGRMGKSGTVISIITPQERFIIEKFKKQLGIEIEERFMFKGELVNEEKLRLVTQYKPASNQIQNQAPKAKNRIESVAKSVPVPVEVSKPNGSSELRKPVEKVVRKNNGKIEKATVKSKAKKNDGKNKGAPKWLKAKRDGNPS